MNIKLFIGTVFLLLPFLNYSQTDLVYEITRYNDTSSLYYVETAQDSNDIRYDTLAPPLFWSRIMSMSPDSCLINIADTREVLIKTSFIEWSKQTEPEKQIYKDSVRKMFDLPDETTLYVTNGKREYYLLKNMLPGIKKAIKIFIQEDVNPWFAQAILLVESPGALNYSVNGAYGHFQLMAHIAIKQGLIINDTLDERENFEKSARATAGFIKNVCIPEARSLIRQNNLEWQPEQLWTQLVVLHIYHAGTPNVAAVLKKINPTKGGMQLIQKMWRTEAASFKNASQNYSQIALATLLIIEDMMLFDCLHHYSCTQ